MQELQREQNKAKFDIMDVDFDENGEIIEENPGDFTEITEEMTKNVDETVENTENSQKIDDKEE
jgi:hypothetical protein